jgi:hypothetical protein
MKRFWFIIAAGMTMASAGAQTRLQTFVYLPARRRH